MKTPKKLSALRGPKLFGKVMPREHNETRTEWQSGGVFAYVEDVGPAWSCCFSLDGMVSQRGVGFSSRSSAIRGLERALKAAVRDARKLGCP